MILRLKLLDWQRIISYALLAISYLVIAGTAVWGTDKEPPTLGEVIGLTLVSGALQLSGAAMLNRAGKADASLARSAVRRLLGMVKKAQEARILAEEARELTKIAEMRNIVGILSRDLSHLEDGCVQEIENWQDIHERALKDILRKDL
jgi:hypothetical protein